MLQCPICNEQSYVPPDEETREARCQNCGGTLVCAHQNMIENFCNDCGKEIELPE